MLKLIKKIFKFSPKCGICKIKNVRLYRPYGNSYRTKDNRCNIHVTTEQRGWYVPLIIDKNSGLPWGYTSVPDDDCQKFYILPEADSKGLSWGKFGWPEN